MKTLPILGTYTMTISNTGLTGSYGIASEATTTTVAYNEKIYSNDLMTLKPLMDLSAASAVVTYAFAGDIISAVATELLTKMAFLVHFQQQDANSTDTTGIDAYKQPLLTLLHF